MKLFYGVSVSYENTHRLLQGFRLDESTQRALQVLEIAVDQESIKKIDRELILLKDRGVVPAEGVDLDTTVLIEPDASSPMPSPMQMRANELEMERRQYGSTTSYQLDPIEVMNAKNLFAKLLIQLGSFFNLSVFAQDMTMQQVLFGLEVRKVDPYVISQITVPLEMEQQIHKFASHHLKGSPPAAIYLVPVR